MGRQNPDRRLLPERDHPNIRGPHKGPDTKIPRSTPVRTTTRQARRHITRQPSKPLKLSLGPAKKPSSGTISEATILLRDVFSQSYWGPGKLPYVFGGSFMRSATNTPRTPRSAAAAIA